MDWLQKRERDDLRFEMGRGEGRSEKSEVQSWKVQGQEEKSSLVLVIGCLRMPFLSLPIRTAALNSIRDANLVLTNTCTRTAVLTSKHARTDQPISVARGSAVEVRRWSEITTVRFPVEMVGVYQLLTAPVPAFAQNEQCTGSNKFNLITVSCSQLWVSCFNVKQSIISQTE